MPSSAYCYDLRQQQLSQQVRPVGRVTYVKQVTKYIEEHYQEQITVDDIAKALHLNRSYLSTLYKVNSQKSIKQYLQHHRILRSTMLLQRTNLSIAEIAMEVGFKDSLYFSRIFKAHMRCSPTQYRAQYQ